jgi:hypothetical protein
VIRDINIITRRSLILSQYIEYRTGLYARIQYERSLMRSGSITPTQESMNKTPTQESMNRTYIQESINRTPTQESYNESEYI